MAEKKTFEIGLVMAGAVSAGAYTAGVMDYLLGVLDTWEEAKRSGENVPDHDVVIKVMTGASAGGMTTAITSVELLRRANHPGAVNDPNYKSLMYQAWVDKIDITRLLGTDDLRKFDYIKSMLDSTVISEIAADVIDENKMPPWKPLPYLDKELKLYITLSNLRGLPYEFKLNGETGLPYGMTDHADYQYIEIREDTTKADWIKLRNAAVATGAFPVGLASRLIQRDMNEYKVRINKDGRDISGLMKVKSDENSPYNFIAVDGGTLNNEPIELARSVWEQFTEEDKQEIKSVTDLHRKREEVRLRTVLVKNPYALVMIDPFPDQVDIGEDATEEDTALINIVGPILGTLRSQSLFKIEELLRAGDREKNDRFLIAPIRYTETDNLAKNAIACGFFSGFGGFLAREFREHDYQLGRRNAQRFLDRYFSVSIEAAAKENGWNVNPDYVYVDKKDKQSYYPIIPIIKGSEVSKPQGEHNTWPKYKNSHARSLRQGLSVRVRALLQKALPFGWIDQSWVTIVMIFAGLLAIAGEWVKVIRSTCNCLVFLEGFRNSYILILQLLFVIVLLVLLVLRIAKKTIANRLVNKAYNLFLSQMRSWGIERE
ncbi:MAG TPA: patatin-like phospholipase family protein [Cyclobacteriaceae bacterium]|nr:patatin-like phospholipase family protein [Cyclobacteriaceae bacterium]